MLNVTFDEFFLGGGLIPPLSSPGYKKWCALGGNGRYPEIRLWLGLRKSIYFHLIDFGRNFDYNLSYDKQRKKKKHWFWGVGKGNMS
jgi:hypothetical protein